MPVKFTTRNRLPFVCCEGISVRPPKVLAKHEQPWGFQQMGFCASSCAAHHLSPAWRKCQCSHTTSHDLDCQSLFLGSRPSPERSCQFSKTALQWMRVPLDFPATQVAYPGHVFNFFEQQRHLHTKPQRRFLSLIAGRLCISQLLQGSISAIAGPCAQCFHVIRSTG
jgi:hypothetical protein